MANIFEFSQIKYFFYRKKYLRKIKLLPQVIQTVLCQKTSRFTQIRHEGFVSDLSWKYNCVLVRRAWYYGGPCSTHVKILKAVTSLGSLGVFHLAFCSIFYTIFQCIFIYKYDLFFCIFLNILYGYRKV